MCCLGRARAQLQEGPVAHPMSHPLCHTLYLALCRLVQTRLPIYTRTRVHGRRSGNAEEVLQGRDLRKLQQVYGVGVVRKAGTRLHCSVLHAGSVGPGAWSTLSVSLALDRDNMQPSSTVILAP